LVAICGPPNTNRIVFSGEGVPLRKLWGGHLAPPLAGPGPFCDIGFFFFPFQTWGFWKIRPWFCFSSGNPPVCGISPLCGTKRVPPPSRGIGFGLFFAPGRVGLAPKLLPEPPFLQSNPGSRVFFSILWGAVPEINQPAGPPLLAFLPPAPFFRNSVRLICSTSNRMTWAHLGGPSYIPTSRF